MSKKEDIQKVSTNKEKPISSEIKTITVKEGIWRTYDGTDGLPSGNYYCLLQDRHGYLWVGTQNGLCRYDGARFVTYTTEDGLPANTVMSACEDSQGLLWFGTDNGVSCYNGVEFTIYTTEDGLVGNVIRSICEDSQGHIWFGTEIGGICCYDGENFTKYTNEDEHSGHTVWSICEDSQGNLWFGTSGGVSCWDGEEFIKYTTQHGLAGNNVAEICEDSQGSLWFGTMSEGVSCWDGEQFINYTTQHGLSSNNMMAVYKDRQGYLWFVTFGGGVCRFDGSSFTTYTTTDGLLDNRMSDMFQDREGIFWFIHWFGGLTRFDSETVRLLTEDTASLPPIQSNDGALWFGDDNQLCCLYRGEQRCQTLSVFSMLEDSRGRFWMGVARDGLYCYDSADAVWEGKPKRFTTEDELNSDMIWSIMEARDGTIWVGTEGSPGCLCQFNDGRFEKIRTPHNVVQLLLEDNCGRIWMGGWNGGGLSYYDPGEGYATSLQNYTMQHGLPSDDVISITEDDTNRLWIGTRNGLCCFDGNQFIHYGEETLGYSHCDFSVRDVNGHLWFGTLGNGVYRYDGRHFQQLSKADGLPSNSVTGFIPQEDGSMIISTYRGIVHYRPTDTESPRIEIREVLADQVHSYPSTVELTDTGASLVTITYHGLSLSTQRMRYSYILEGYDEEWHETWENQVRYENLPAGEYIFRVIAINRDLVTSEVPATLKISIVPDPRDTVIDTLQTELHYLRREAGSKYHFKDIIGSSQGIRLVRALMEKAIDSGLTVLIIGETGTGKELVAKAIHYTSPRKSHPLLDRNCAAIPKDLLASELFGHRKGAFTGAQEDKMGLFEAASGGTVLLDEISEMSEDAQVHLLRVLEEREVQRLGEHTSREVDVRIIAMTNRDLMKEVTEGRFREDLYYRLSEFPISIPPLRERPEDIPLLAEHFLHDYIEEHEKELDGFAPDVFEMLQSYPWPGNVRELRNAVRRAAALAEEGKQIQTYHFPPEIRRGESLIHDAIGTGSSYSETVRSFQRRFIEQVLRECEGNRHEAARRLKMDRANLLRLIKRLGISQ